MIKFIKKELEIELCIRNTSFKTEMVSTNYCRYIFGSIKENIDFKYNDIDEIKSRSYQKNI